MNRTKDLEKKDNISPYKKFLEFSREALEQPDFKQTIIDFTIVFFSLSKDLRIEYDKGVNNSRDFTCHTTGINNDTIKMTVLVPCNNSTLCKEQDFIPGINMALIKDGYNEQGERIRKIVNPTTTSENAQEYFDVIQKLVDEALQI
jgi:hypothetical protein